MGRRVRIGEWLAMAVVVAVILAIVLWPTPVDQPFEGPLSHTLTWLHSHGVPAWFDYDFVEASANVIMFVPLGALVASLAIPPLWWCSTLLGLFFSLCIEFTQYVFLPERFASAGDLAANTLGATLGGCAIAALRALRRMRQRRARLNSHAIQAAPRL